MVDEYTVLKSIHVLFAAFWVGGGCVLNLAMLLAPRSGDRANVLGAMRLTRFFGQYVLPVLATIVIASGIWLTEQFYAWDQLWIGLGMAGAVLVTAIGIFYLGPRSAKAIAGMEAGQPPPPGRNWAPIVARLNLLIISAVLVLMVIRPT
jgi:putative copper export protein